MNPWQEVLERIEARDDDGLATFLDGLNDLGRRAVALQLPGHLSEELRGGVRIRWEIEELAPGYRMAGAACLAGAQQVATWLNRRELRRVREPERDAERIVSLLRRRPLEWRRDLAVRLADRLRPPVGRTWRRMGGVPNWHLAAALIPETGVEPPDGDAFVVGWLWRVALRRDAGGPGLDGDPLLGSMLPRLFQAQGVGEPLLLRERWNGGGLVADLAGLTGEGRVPRRTVLDGCATRFLTGGSADEITPFVRLWQLLRPEPEEIPVLDFVRLLPSAVPPLAQLALDELRRADGAGLLDDELFAEAVGSLAYRPEKKLLQAAVQWLARTPAPRSAGAVAALAPLFDLDSPALRERAVRLAVRLAPHTDDAGRAAIREAASRLPADLRERVAAGYGAVAAQETGRPVAAVLSAPALPALPRQPGSPAELVAEIRALTWPEDPSRCELLLGRLVELAHHDRDGVIAALRPWWKETRRQGGPYHDVFDRSAQEAGVSILLARCALALVAPEKSRKIETGSYVTSQEWPPQAFVRRRYEEVIALLERGGTTPVLLATPTSPTGHVDAGTLVERMELLGETEPLETDFRQALLRLPRQFDRELLVRAEQLPSRAGRELAAWMRDGGWPNPDADCRLREVEPSHDAGCRGLRCDGVSVLRCDAVSDEQSYVLRVEVVPPEGLPAWLAELWTAEPQVPYLSHPGDALWWPWVLPSHREIVATWLVRCRPWLARSYDFTPEALATLAHGDGPVGAATAFTLAGGLARRRDAQRAQAADAALTLAACGQFPAAELGWVLADLIRHEYVPLKAITDALGDLAAAGAHAEVWRTLAVALPSLLPGPGERARAGLGGLLGVAAHAAELAGAKGEVPGLAELAARKGTSLLLQEAGHLYETITP
ncbi:DUF7825 domain-containing protein [Nonomuraea maritima]|uniref:DUF7825 domain-containing protein n=1 Tax=Nonomuraea maritima TaxID=683260 RepID=UPI00371CB0F7